MIQKMIHDVWNALCCWRYIWHDDEYDDDDNYDDDDDVDDGDDSYDDDDDNDDNDASVMITT